MGGSFEGEEFNIGRKKSEASRARAVIEGRTYVRPCDVEWVAQPVLAHRLVLTTDATVDGVAPGTVVSDALDRVPVPSVSQPSESQPTAH
jgi:MoxR-like ATPase